MKVHEGRTGSSSSPTRIHLARPPRMGAWRGPLPRRRVTPLPVLGDFIDKATATSPSVVCGARGSALR
jgi:hypothetical protein